MTPVEKKIERETALERKIVEIKAREEAKIAESFRKELVAWIKNDPCEEAHTWRLLLQIAAENRYEGLGAVRVSEQFASGPAWKAMTRRAVSDDPHTYIYECDWEGQTYQLSLGWYEYGRAFLDRLEADLQEWKGSKFGLSSPLFKKI